METIKIGIVDDHRMLSAAIEKMISINKKYEVVCNSYNGEEFIDRLETDDCIPEVVLMDVNMPIKNGIETTQHLKDHFPDIKVIALTMEDDEKTIIAMLKAGARGYLLKDMSPKILFEAIDTVYEKGVFYTDMVTQCLLNIRTEENEVKDSVDDLKDREKEFIKLACSEMTYKEIAEVMFLSPKTIDGYRDSVFTKLDVKSRVGLVLFALKHNMN
ncbi:response regulator transcription factor [Frigoriflavimonas asaccharolytica]|uniref:DNA-binding NarL/FixJ family response regulator n=1 Tax=Frigoriflavimonas asaccharolytica TaxID=2735899 RepID=A0A8J8GAF7_9FLAO|nr:response regulator transcription factor [Frigoriflavimonas asaccharolytica]NRS92017.1 DNA-binding NarL/FixJ family response regulator [Frigoriflavimonas asaccharolytica]